MVHTVRFESVRRKRDTSLNQKSVKCCYIGVLFRGETIGAFSLAAGLGHSGEPQWTACIRDLGGTKSGKRNKLKTKKKQKNDCLNQ